MTVITLLLATDSAEWAIGHTGGPLSRKSARAGPGTRKGRADHHRGDRPGLRLSQREREVT